MHKSNDMYIEMPFSDCISWLICIYREGISLPHNFHENYATCSGNPMSKSIKMHLPLSWWACFVSANIPFFKRSAFFTKIFLWNKKSDELYIVSTVFGFLINGSLLWTITLIWRQIRFPEAKVPNVTAVTIR